MTDPRTTITEPHRLAALWTGLLLAPTAFLANLELGYLVVHGSCLGRSSLPGHVVHALCLLAALAGTLVAWRVWDDTGRMWPGEAGGPPARTRFLAGLGLATSALFVLVIVAQWIPNFILSPCQ